MTAHPLSQAVFVVMLGAGMLAQVRSPDPSYTVAYASFGPLNTALFIANADGSGERPLLDGPFLDMNPSVSPDGEWVLFSSRRTGSADIYRVRLDGTGLERLTDHPAFDDQPVMSPSGREVAFVSSRSGQADIWILDIASRQLRNLTNHPGGDYRPAWSPDEERIAFTSDRDTDGARARTPATSGAQFSAPQTTEIYTIRRDGSELGRMTDGDVSVGSAVWSPDGRRLVYYQASPVDWRAMNTDFRGGPAQATSQIVALDVTTAERELLTAGPGRKYSPRFVGHRIAYLAGDPSEKRGQRQRVNYVSAGIAFVDGHAAIAGAFSNVSWTPDGTRFVFHREVTNLIWPPLTPTFSASNGFRAVRAGVYPSWSGDGRQLMTNTAYAGQFRNTIMLMNPDGTNRRVVFDDPGKNAIAPVWSPDGRRIAVGLVPFGGGLFAGARSGMPGQVMVMNADGSGVRAVTDERNHLFPSWSPDGRRLVFRSAVGATKRLTILDLETGGQTFLTDGRFTDNFPAWSPKGELILFTSDRDGDWELYTIRSDGTDVKRLTNSPGNDAHATWSHDGEWIAFASARGGFKDEMPIGEGGGQGAGDIFVMRADGSDVRQITDDAFEEATPAFAPTRSRTDQ